MRLQTRLLIVVGIVSLSIFASLQIVSFQLERRHTEERELAKAEVIRGVLMSYRKIYQKKFLKHLLPLNEKTLPFLPAYAMSEISKEFSQRWSKTGIIFNNVSENPRNPINQADIYELKAIRFFHRNPLKTLYFNRFKDERGDDFYLYARPIRIQEDCLKCHGHKQEAPMTIRRHYRTAFNYKIGDLRGILSIKLPVASTYKNAMENIRKTLYVHLFWFFILLLAVSFIMHYYITYPMKELLSSMERFSQGNYDERVRPLRGKEFRLIGETFNKMAAQIQEDIEKEKKSELKRQQLMTAIEHSAETIKIFNREGFLEYVNPIFEKLTGFHREEILGQRIDHFWANDSCELDGEVLLRAVKESRSWQGELCHRKKDGSFFPVLVNLTPIYNSEGKLSNFVTVEMDITERNAAKEVALRSQKMESLGILAGGIAHDFNNLLSGILNYAELVQKKIDDREELLSYLERIQNITEEAAHLTQQMLTYSGKGTFSMAIIDLNDEIRRITRLLEVSIPYYVELTFEFGENLPYIRADKTQIYQILMNLLINSVEAIGERQGQRITIRTDARYIDPEGDLRYHGSRMKKAGYYVLLSVSDTGEGMDPKTLDRLFEPFYSTKFTGRGLGLSSVLGIVRSHHGLIEVQSELGKGTTFNIFFPVDKSGEYPEESIDDVQEKKELEKVSSEETMKILLVDDQRVVREVTKVILEEMGYEVMTAEGGEEALHLFDEHFEELEVVILDLIMPKLNGYEVLRKMREKKKDIAIILISGFAQQDLPEPLAECEGGRLEFLAKPFSSKALLKKIQSLQPREDIE